MKRIIILMSLLIIGIGAYSQQFEDQKSDLPEFEKLKVKVGGDFAVQLQALGHSNTNDTIDFYDMVNNFNLPTANLNLDVYLAYGVKMHLRTYLSSRHHNEAWVKGGYVQFDRLDFLSEGFLSGLMDVTTLKFGLDEINYGDAHFRRTDNAYAINNPFVGNYIMDAFTTEAFGEVVVQKSGFVGVIGFSNGKLNQNVTVNARYNHDNALSFYGKLGYDKQFTDEFRGRLTGSWYINQGTSTGSYLYGGDRAGSRYYSVLVVDGEDDNFTSGRFNPSFSQITAIQINPFIKFKGLEFFGIYEIANGGEDDGDGSFTQLAADLLYRFGGDEQFYIGGRYNKVSGEQTSASESFDIERFNVGGGWFLTENIVAKLEYVSQKYSGNGVVPTIGASYKGAEFNGLMLEAAISF
ncbi:MAG: hypothetical protein SVU94_09005 [Bacteroidota bacterium]|nr:hypothetical protein [Bacteroidota bacterium]